MYQKELEFEKLFYDFSATDERLKEKIYKRYWGYLMGVVRRYITDREEAKEIVNDSFLKAFNGIRKFVYDGNPENFSKAFTAWLVRITVNTTIDRLRRRRNLVVYEEVSEEIVSPFVEIQEKLNVRDILKLFESLPELQRIVFNLHEIEGYSHEEISSMLNIPASSSRVYLTKAKQRIRVLYTRKFLKA